jgi:cell fate regulator YaaT (PSP1 superfamily)
LPQLVEVRFKGNRKDYFTLDQDTPLTVGDHVVVALERGRDLGRVSAVGETAERKCGVGCSGCALAKPNEPTGRILKRASSQDTHLSEELRKAEEDVRRKVRERVAAHHLSMKVSDAEWQWDRKKLTIYFTADKRVDFRALVRDLASLFRTRIEMRQIGARDETKRLDGVGRCGRQYCCSSWLPELKPVSLSLAKDQRLSLNPTQISGGCGRLLCCLRYEHDFYVSSRKRFPKEGKTVRTAGGVETVLAVDIFRDRLQLRTGDGSTRVVGLAELKQEMAGRPPEVPEVQAPSALASFDDRDEPITAEDATDAVTLGRKRRRRRRGRSQRRGASPDDRSKPEDGDRDR